MARLSWLMLGTLLLASAALPAKTIFKCRASGGVVSYQDEPCPGRQIGVIRTSEQSAAPSNPRAATTKASATAAASAPAAPSRSPRPSFQCTRPDGSRYFTADVRPRRVLVDRLAGAAAALPGAPGAPPGKMWAEDVCEAATRAQTCDYYSQQIAQVVEKAARAAGTEQRQLTREHQRLKAIHNHRCVRGA
jgi:hypothetical protein